jgi:hypothetical protein
MSFRLSLPTLPKLAWLAALLLASIAGCGGSNKNAFAPACPRAGILGDAADLTRYREGGGRDITDLVLAGRILGVSGQCKPGDSKTQLETSMQVTLGVTRGPGMTQRQADLTVFVAVSDGDDILDKRLFPVHLEFPSNTDSIRITTEPVTMQLPISAQKSGAAYALTAGFQLTPEELELNRLRPQR